MNIRFTGMLALLVGLVLPPSVPADSLGRIFTSEQDRNRLDYIRKQKPLVEKKMTDTEEVDEVFEEEQAEEEIVIRDTLNLKGFVRRSDGKNSAWINEGNTYEGDLDTIYIKVRPEDIGDDKVTINMPDNETRVRLKVGEAYDPDSKQVLKIRNN
ncbi:MAG: hypothetical protein RIB78_01210 [Gammaproteobacteria bacterium]